MKNNPARYCRTSQQIYRDRSRHIPLRRQKLERGYEYFHLYGTKCVVVLHFFCSRKIRSISMSGIIIILFEGLLLINNEWDFTKQN